MSVLGGTFGTDRLGPLIDAALAQHGGTIDHPAPGVWHATGGAAGGAAAAFVVKADDGWLTMDAIAPNDVAGQSPTRILARAATLPGCTKLVAAAPDDCIHLRAELPLDDDADLASEGAALIAAFTKVQQDGAVAATGSTDASAEEQSSSRLAERCAEAGWPAVERPDGELAVELEVPGRFVQATVRRRQEWWIDLPMVSGEPQSAVCREASALLLLRVGGLVRLVQAALLAGDEALPGLRVGLPPALCTSFLGHAFAALSMACRLCTREAAVLWGDEHIARAYLDRAVLEGTNA